MTRKKFIRKVSKYADEAMLFSSEVLKIEEQNISINEKFKTVFYCKSSKFPEGRMCIAWGRTNIQVGDIVHMKGRIKDDVFLVWSMNFQRPNSTTPQEPCKSLEELKNKILKKIKEGQNEQSTN